MQSKKEAEGKNTSRGKSRRPLLLSSALLLLSAFPEPREKAKEDRRKERGVA
jgi:hypothetical protein